MRQLDAGELGGVDKNLWQGSAAPFAKCLPRGLTAALLIGIVSLIKLIASI